MPQEIHRISTLGGPGWTSVIVTKNQDVVAEMQIRNGCPPECLQTLHDQIKELMAGEARE